MSPVAPPKPPPPPPPPRAPPPMEPVSLPVEPAEAVVADGELQDVVVGRAAEVRPVGRRGQLGGQHPPAGAGHDGRAGQQQLPDPLAQPWPARPTGRPARTRARPGTPAASWPGTRSRAATPAAPATWYGRPRSPGPSAYAAAVISRTSSASGLLNRNISTATGVSAITSPASSPAAGPNQRRTAAYSSATAGHALERLRDQQAPVVDAEDPGRTAPSPTATPASCPR